MSGTRRKVLFFAEGATLAHVGRPFVLAESLDPNEFELAFARPPAYAWLTAKARFRLLDLSCQDGATFARRLEQGRPLYDLGTLERYVADDLALIDAERPDVIVGDFRLSLSVSARLRRVPYITLCDAYWSPEQPLVPTLPVLGFTRFTPLPLAERIFRAVSGPAMRLHTLPIERLRRKHGLPSLGFDLRRCYTDADLRLFANFAALFPDIAPSNTAGFIGPIAWSPEATPETDFLKTQDGFVYVTMGSSGDPLVLRTLIPILEQTGAPIVVASAGKPLPPGLNSSRTRVFDYLPGDLACRHAKLVVCNGGSPTTNQALANGVPVLGIARNMDQFLNMRAIERFGAGVLVRADRAGTRQLAEASQALLKDGRFAERAGTLARSFEPEAPTAALSSHVKRLLAARGSPA
jgi:UDP:flavonoid glycosyltransferase YjiC (YdhE family)